MPLSTMTSKGQTTIPKSVRDRLGLKTGSQIDFVVQDDGTALMVPRKGSIHDLKGLLPKPARAVTIEEMDAAIRQAAVDRAKT